jgi:hypothetical protein
LGISSAISYLFEEAILQIKVLAKLVFWRFYRSPRPIANLAASKSFIGKLVRRMPSFIPSVGHRRCGWDEPGFTGALRAEGLVERLYRNLDVARRVSSQHEC